MGILEASFVTTGQVVEGVCYATAFRWAELDARSSPIPPERVGIDGRYDHQGLAKRVRLKFSEVLGSEPVANIGVQQRGSVIILYGRVSHKGLLERLVHLAIEVEGTTNVEIRQVVVDFNLLT